MPRAIIIAALAFGCAAPRPRATPPDPYAKVPDQIAALDARLGLLERTPRDDTPKWSCSAKCGHQSPRTSAFHILFRYVVGEGRSAAAAYKQLVDACDDGQLFENTANERMVGGDMKSVCVESR